MQRTESSNDEITPLVVVSDSPESTDSIRCCGSLAVYKPVLWRVSFYALYFLKIAVPYITLIGQFLYHFFLLPQNYALAPTDITQKTWLGFVVIGVAVALALTAMCINALGKHGYRAAQDYIAALFSSTLSLMFFKVLCTTNAKLESMPLTLCVPVIVCSIALTSGLFFKLVLPDSHDDIVYGSKQVTPIDMPNYPSVSISERVLNVLAAMIYGGTSLSTVLTHIMRQLAGKTTSFSSLHYVIIALYLGVSGVIGYRLTDHPRCFQQFAAFSNFWKFGALSYSGFSSIFFLLGVYQSADRTFSLDQHSRAFLTGMDLLFAFCVGLFAAVTTCYPLQNAHESNGRIISFLQRSLDKCHTQTVKMSNTCGDTFRKTSDGCMHCWQFFTEKTSACCKREENEETVLVNNTELV